MQIVIIAAVGENGVIGRDNGLPWRLKSDLKHFRALTLGRPVVMGRKTFLSLGKPLPGRTNIVVSRDKDFVAIGAMVAPTLAAAMEAARGDALRRGSDLVIAGGADIYAQAMPMADRLEITRVHASPTGDSRFPPIDPAIWREAARSPHPAGADDDFAFDSVTYLRTGAAGATEGRAGPMR